MSRTKRIDNPCPWCGTRCCKIDGPYTEWACGSKAMHDGTSWQSPGCRVREIDQTDCEELVGKLRAKIKRLETIIHEAHGYTCDLQRHTKAMADDGRFIPPGMAACIGGLHRTVKSTLTDKRAKR